MKLDTSSFISSPAELEEKLFSIGDPNVIFDVLRSKMYSNPILAICREIPCNARDAHREVGTPDLPVRIHLPNHDEPYYKVKDWGPGITPDRITDIYTKYGVSTKRDDNVQTGFFGLGSKVGWSYSSSFSVITNVSGVQYNYSCFVDDSKVGKLALLHQAPTKEPNGTEIQIPVQPSNFYDFQHSTEKACQHWKTKPTIKGGNITWTEYQHIMNGERWVMVKSNSYERQAKLIIDGIEYPLPEEAFEKSVDREWLTNCAGNYFLYFDNGEISLSANREQVYLDDKTQQVLEQRIKSMCAEIKQTIDQEIQALPNLWEAQVYGRINLSRFFSYPSFLNLAWRGHKLERDAYTSCPVFYFSKSGRHSLRRWGKKKEKESEKIYRSSNRRIAFEKDSLLYVNDLPLKEPALRHVKKLFDADPKLQSVQVVCPNEKATIEELNESIQLDLLAPQKLSSIAKASPRARTHASAKLTVFKFDRIAERFSRTSYAAIEEDANDKVLCLMDKGYAGDQKVQVEENTFLIPRMLQALLKQADDVSLYGIAATTPAERIKEDFSDMTELGTFIEKVLKNQKVNFLEVADAYRHKYDVDEGMLRDAKELLPKITDPKSMFLRRLTQHEKVRMLCEQYVDLWSIYETVKEAFAEEDINKYLSKHPEYNLPELDKEYHERYPLLRYLNSYSRTEASEGLVQYVNLVDASVR